MKSFGIIAASALFGAIANAAPLNKRDVVWVTEIATDVVTVPVTMTVWADAEETSVSTTTSSSRHGHQFFHSKASTTSTPDAVVSTSTSSSAYVAPTPSSTSVYVAPTPSTTSIYVAPTTSSSEVYVAPTTSSSEVYVAPTTSSSEVYVAPTTSSVYVAPETTSTYVAPTIESTSVYAAPTTSTTSSAPAATTSASSGSGVSSGLAASGTEYTGDLTWYDVGLGACGLTSTSDEAIVAISQDIFDNAQYKTANPNLNPLCGKYVTITGKDGSSYQAKVVDRCVGCAEADLDLSQGFFNTVTNNGDGRVAGMSWTWN
ncbi:hypothetical protein E4T52_08141 [Aureobasidium sp. EXF-3400]|nr:hypothetical protein E4T51_07202 [Aureobasidium sp. EXF-12344]KAI4776933.1 hypothetical protein E4T52_08141 [Aureobasidium sp. EXF-3400]